MEDLSGDHHLRVEFLVGLSLRTVVGVEGSSARPLDACKHYRVSFVYCSIHQYIILNGAPPISRSFISRAAQ